MSVDGLRESRRGELGKELVGSHPSQDRLYHWFKSNDYGRILSDNNAYIKDKRMVCLSYRSEFEVIRNFCAPQDDKSHNQCPSRARTGLWELRATKRRACNLAGQVGAHAAVA